MFLLIFLILLGTVYGYPAWRLLAALSPSSGVQWAVGLGLFASASLPMVYLFVLRGSGASQGARRAVAWVAYGGMGCAVAFFDVVLARDLLWGALWLVDLLRPHAAILPVDPAVAERWLRASGWLALAAGTLLSAWGLYSAHRRPRIRHITVAIPGLAPGLEGLRIAQVPDLHVGPTIRRRFVEAVVATVDDLEPDLIAFTGDLADGGALELADQVAPLSRLSAPLGLWAVTGNHEYYSEPEGWLQAMQNLGLQLLLNRHQVLDRGGDRLVIGGLADPAGREVFPDRTEHHADPAAVFAAAPEGLRLLLAHQPRAGMAAAASGAYLVLSGHTHGGQLFPWSLIVRLQQPLVAGLHHTPWGGWIYVSRGAGYWGPPMRLGVASEITCLTLTAS